MKNRNFWIFLSTLLAATILCGFSGYAPGDGILISPLTAGFLSIALTFAPRLSVAPVFWLIPLGAITCTSWIFKNFSALFVGIALFLTAALIFVCYHKKFSRTTSVIIVAAAFLFGIVTLALFGLMSLTDGELSRAAINAQIDKLVNSLTDYIQKALLQEVENLSDAVSSLVRSFIVSLPGYFCAAALLCSYLATGLFRTFVQKKEDFARTWAFSLPRVNAIIYLVLLAISFFSSDTTVSVGLNNVMTLLQMAFALFGFCYFRAIFSAKRFGEKSYLTRYYVAVLFLYLVAPIAGVILPSLSPSANSFASFLLMLPMLSYTVFYIGGLVGAFKTPPTSSHESK